METIIPEISEIKGKNTEYGKTYEPPNLNQKKIYSQVHKLNLANINQDENDKNKKETKKVNLGKQEDLKDEENYDIKDENENINNINNDEKDGSRKYYSDALQLLNELSEKNKNDENEKNNNNEDNLFGFGHSERYFPSGKPIDNNKKKTTDKVGKFNYSQSGQILYDDNNSYYKSGEHIGNNTKNINKYNNIYRSVSDTLKSPNNTKYSYNYLSINNKYKDDPRRLRQMQNNWRYFSKEIKKISGVYLLQTIGAIIKAIKILRDDLLSRKKIILYEKIKLFKLLEENEAVVEFLNKESHVKFLKNPIVTKRRKFSNKDLDVIKEETSEDENDTDEFMLPDENPEKTLSLNELDEKLRDISILLENKKLGEEQRRKIEILKNLLLQQKI